MMIGGNKGSKLRKEWQIKGDNSNDITTAKICGDSCR
ncbi:hypothetical protein EDD66_112117 [Mobilisporobacter senegalensis]|uniref:Uncharacterized protein n=1 Tax=Mobilisporobacter senegalensis TaxID=1329262 RepID=A0A3N1XB63_9FIRM|nr:hypothetical protein EDD66_112117 [Mobilisporobacter senegalensis]